MLKKLKQKEEKLLKKNKLKKGKSKKEIKKLKRKCGVGSKI